MSDSLTGRPAAARVPAAWSSHSRNSASHRQFRRRDETGVRVRRARARMSCLLAALGVMHAGPHLRHGSRAAARSRADRSAPGPGGRSGQVGDRCGRGPGGSDGSEPLGGSAHSDARRDVDRPPRGSAVSVLRFLLPSGTWSAAGTARRCRINSTQRSGPEIQEDGRSQSSRSDIPAVDPVSRCASGGETS